MKHSTVPNVEGPPLSPSDERIIADFCRQCDLPERDAYTSLEVVQLCQGMEYDCDEDTLQEFDEKGYCEKPPGPWTPRRIRFLIANLESRRRWQKQSRLHDPKKSLHRLRLEALDASEPHPAADIDKYTLEDLLLWLAKTDDRNIREGLYEAAKIKLDLLGIQL